MLVGKLKRVDDAQNLIEIAVHAHRVGHREADLLVRIDDEAQSFHFSTQIRDPLCDNRIGRESK